MSVLSKFQPVFIVISVLMGVVLGELIPILEQYAGNFIEIFLMCMLFFVFLSVEIKEISKSFLDLRFSAASLIVNFVFTPLFTFILSKLFLSGHIDLQIGFIMLMVTPCTDWYLIFIGIAKGNVPLGASVLPLNLILQIVLLPVYLLLFMGTEVSFGPGAIIHSIVLVLVIPLVTANTVKLTARKINRTVGVDRQQFECASRSNSDGAKFEKILKKAGDISFALLCLAIISMFASQGAALLNNSILFIRLLPALVIFFVVLFFLSLCIGKMLKLPFRNIIPLVFVTSARNSPVSLAIATMTFPVQPVISLVLVMGPLLELPMLAIISSICRAVKSNPAEAGEF